jgi:hypothetical protein
LILEDMGSMNGTFVEPGQLGLPGDRLKPGVPRSLRVGDRFYLGDARFMFEVKDGRN